MKMNHVGIMVGDMDKAVEFYTQALGLKVVMGSTKVIEERETAIGRMCIAVFGEVTLLNKYEPPNLVKYLKIKYD